MHSAIAPLRHLWAHSLAECPLPPLPHTKTPKMAVRTAGTMLRHCCAIVMGASCGHTASPEKSTEEFMEDTMLVMATKVSEPKRRPWKSNFGTTPIPLSRLSAMMVSVDWSVKASKKDDVRTCAMTSTLKFAIRPSNIDARRCHLDEFAVKISMSEAFIVPHDVLVRMAFTPSVPTMSICK